MEIVEIFFPDCVILPYLNLLLICHRFNVKRSSFLSFTRYQYCYISKIIFHFTQSCLKVSDLIGKFPLSMPRNSHISAGEKLLGLSLSPSSLESSQLVKDERFSAFKTRGEYLFTATGSRSCSSQLRSLSSGDQLLDSNLGILRRCVIGNPAWLWVWKECFLLRSEEGINLSVL